jgi:ubiquinone/menaquinone biosynthesis C-methylase UbiE
LSSRVTAEWEERFVPGAAAEVPFRESEMRYLFAGAFARGRTVLDLASGTGIGTHFLLQSGAKKCIGLDLDLDAVRYATVHYSDCTFAVCDGTRLCLPDGCVDLIVSFETIEHLSDMRAFFGECKRVLHNDGILLCSTPNRDVTRWDGADNPFHVREIAIDEFLQLANQFFVECRLYGQSEVNYPVHVMRRCFINLMGTMHLKRALKRLLPASPVQICAETEFSPVPVSSSAQPVRPHVPKRYKQPRYAVIVARKLRSIST